MEPIIYSEKDAAIFEKLQKQGPLGKRALFIFQYLFLRKEFRGLVKLIREELEIPPDGLDLTMKEGVEKFSKEYASNYDFNGEVIFQKKIYLNSKSLNTHKSIEQYVEQCGILAYTPNMYMADRFIEAIIKEYILLNDFIGLYKGAFALTSIARYEGDIDDTEDPHEPMELRIEIPVSAKKEEILDYINETWEALEFTKRKILKKKDFIRFRPRTNFIRDLQIFNKYLEIEKLSKKQRQERHIDYIELAVIRELKEEGLSNVPDDGTVRSIVSRLRNEIKDKNSFWLEHDEKSLEGRTTIAPMDDF
ncbi:MAG: hypothetical protein WCK82_06655 [Bacteroidota bacterium]